MNGFSVLRVKENNGKIRYLVNPQSTHDFLHMVYAIIWLWLRKDKLEASFSDSKRAKIIHAIIIVLIIMFSLIGIMLSINVTRPPI